MAVASDVHASDGVPRDTEDRKRRPSSKRRSGASKPASDGTSCGPGPGKTNRAFTLPPAAARSVSIDSHIESNSHSRDSVAPDVGAATKDGNSGSNYGDGDGDGDADSALESRHNAKTVTSWSTDRTSLMSSVTRSTVSHESNLKDDMPDRRASQHRSGSVRCARTSESRTGTPAASSFRNGTSRSTHRRNGVAEDAFSRTNRTDIAGPSVSPSDRRSKHASVASKQDSRHRRSASVSRRQLLSSSSSAHRHVLGSSRTSHVRSGGSVRASRTTSTPVASDTLDRHPATLHSVRSPSRRSRQTDPSNSNNPRAMHPRVAPTTGTNNDGDEDEDDHRHNEQIVNLLRMLQHERHAGKSKLPPAISSPSLSPSPSPSPSPSSPSTPSRHRATQHTPPFANSRNSNSGVQHYEQDFEVDINDFGEYHGDNHICDSLPNNLPCRIVDASSPFYDDLSSIGDGDQHSRATLGPTHSSRIQRTVHNKNNNSNNAISKSATQSNRRTSTSRSRHARSSTKRNTPRETSSCTVDGPSPTPSSVSSSLSRTDTRTTPSRGQNRSTELLAPGTSVAALDRNDAASANRNNRLNDEKHQSSIDRPTDLRETVLEVLNLLLIQRTADQATGTSHRRRNDSGIDDDIHDNDNGRDKAPSASSSRSPAPRHHRGERSQRKDRRITVVRSKSRSRSHRKGKLTSATSHHRRSSMPLDTSGHELLPASSRSSGPVTARRSSMTGAIETIYRDSSRHRPPSVRSDGDVSSGRNASHGSDRIQSTHRRTTTTTKKRRTRSKSMSRRGRRASVDTTNNDSNSGDGCSRSSHHVRQQQQQQQQQSTDRSGCSRESGRDTAIRKQEGRRSTVVSPRLLEERMQSDRAMDISKHFVGAAGGTAKVVSSRRDGVKPRLFRDTSILNFQPDEW